ncbi:MAG: DUF2800 domain-containing protein [Patescibacteria group bacterium]
MTTEQTTYRGSAAPLNCACPASAHPEPGEVLIDSLNPAATVGSAVHAVARVMVDENMVPDIDAILQPFGLTPAQTSEAYPLSFAAWDFWKTSGAAFGGGVETEYELRAGALSAHLDVFSMPFNDEDEPDLAYVLDWKTTRLDLDYTAQLLFYAWLVVLRFPKIKRVKTVIVFLRDRTANIKEWSREQIMDFASEFEQRVMRWDGRSYTPGGHCAYCRRFANCPAHAAMVRHTVDSLIELPGPGVVPSVFDFTPAIEMYQRATAVAKLVDTFKEHVRSAVEHAGGELPGANGQNLKLVPSSRDKINAALAWPVLSPVLSREEMAECTEIRKGDMLKAIAAHAPRGQKAAAKDAIMADLKARGAVETTEFTVLRVVQSKPETKEITIGD